MIDLNHFLDAKGAIAPERGPARKMADFLTTVVAHASDFDRPQDTPGTTCCKCRKRDQRRDDTGLIEEDIVVWDCQACGTQGRISNWQGSFWDLSVGSAPETGPGPSSGRRARDGARARGRSERR